MDLWCTHAKSSALVLRDSVFEKSILRYHSTAVEINVSRGESMRFNSRYQWRRVRALAKKNPGNHSNSNSGQNNNKKSDGDGLKGYNPMESHNSGDLNSKNPNRKPFDWREFRASLYIQEQAEHADFSSQGPGRASPQSQSLPFKWAHPISEPENGCLLVATEKLDGVRPFERTVVLLLRSGQEGPFGVIINRPLNKKMKHMNPTNDELATTFANCMWHFGGPLDASMFLVRATSRFPCLEEVIPGLYFGSRNSLDDTSLLVRKGLLNPQDFAFFMGYAGWQLDQLRQEIEFGYWYLAACSTNLISGVFQSSSSDNLWQEIVQLLGDTTRA